MRTLRAVAATAFLALGLAPAARADDQLYLRWDDCLGDGGAYNKTFACNTNLGSDYLIGSYRLGTTTNQVVGLEVIVYIRGIGTTLSPWWQAQTGGCRQSSVFVTFVPPVTSTTCLDAWAGRASGGSLYEYPGYNTDPGQARLRMVMAVASGNYFTVPAGQEVFAFHVEIKHSKATGSTVCAGCMDPTCLAWGLAKVTQAPEAGNGVTIVGAATPGNVSNVTWQTGAVATTEAYNGSTGPYGDVRCQSVTPARAPSWGAIKTLYR